MKIPPTNNNDRFLHAKLCKFYCLLILLELALAHTYTHTHKYVVIMHQRIHYFVCKCKCMGKIWLLHCPRVRRVLFWSTGGVVLYPIVWNNLQVSFVSMPKIFFLVLLFIIIIWTQSQNMNDIHEGSNGGACFWMLTLTYFNYRCIVFCLKLFFYCFFGISFQE